ncbi:hypothetical protein ILUMI_06221 [Ignelater luminosus]|uniref:Uncharacterized protein n=1 Tax=Ignelater luminosus TaxID=2038154 RepID=A0A8K0DG16_IGNLU|nr:hypothetical protein ILUMI_06221 [Ignelater luminosus]
MLGKTDEMIKMPLFLSHWDATVPVFIPVDVLEDLKSHHLMGVRFLYDCFRKDQKGAILNHENDMNFQIQVSAFFNALSTSVTSKSPVLILSSEKFINAWHYHLTIHGGYDVTILSSKNCKDILLGETHKIIVSTVDNTSLLREIKEVDFFSVVVDEFDLVATKLIIKQLKGQFNIGLTTRNFLKCPDQKLFWTMLSWSNPGVVGKLGDFCIEDSNHLINLRNPYRTWWQRLTWKFCDTFKVPSDEEQKQYKAQLQKWSRQHTDTYLQEKPVRTTRTSRKAASKSVKIEVERKCKEEPMQDVIEENKDVKKEMLQNDSNDLYNTSRNKEDIFTETHNPSQNTKDILNPHTLFTESPCKDDSSNQNNSQNSNSSQDTIVYEQENFPSNSDDENPILSSIISSNSNLMSFDECKNKYYMNVDEDEDILSSIIKN